MAIRVTQNATEVIVQPDNQNLRVTQVAAEPVMAPTSQAIRVSQLVAEVVRENLRTIRNYGYILA